MILLNPWEESGVAEHGGGSINGVSLLWPKKICKTIYSRTSLICSSKLRTPLLSGHHLGNRLGRKGYHLAHAYRKVADCKSWNHLFDLRGELRTKIEKEDLRTNITSYLK